MLIVLTNLGKRFDMTVIIQQLFSLLSSIKLTGDDGDVLFDYSKNIYHHKDDIGAFFQLVISVKHS